MLPIGLSGPDAASYMTALADSHSIHTVIHLTNMWGDRLCDLSDRLLDGQVDVDADAEVTRTSTLTLLDPARRLHFDSFSPADGAIYMDRMIRAYYSVKVPDLGWVDCPVFNGPVTKLDRADDTIHIEASGKEILSAGAAWKPATYKKGFNKIAAIQAILEATGENKFDFPALDSRLPQNFSLARESVPWKAAQFIAQSINMQLFYDARGVARLRTAPNVVTFNFSSGTGGTVLTEPQVAYSLEQAANIVWVKGGVPAGAKLPITYARTAPETHPLSPVRIGRNGVPRYLLKVIENSAITSLFEAAALATTELGQTLLEHIDVGFEALPLPQLEPLDMCRVSTSEFANDFRVKRFSLPLGTGANMTIGYNEDVSPNARLRVRMGRVW